MDRPQARENSIYYKATGKEIEVFEHCFQNRLPLILKGPTGSGKSRFIEYMADRMQRELISIVCHEETSTVDLLGRYIVKGASTEWIDGPLTKAVRRGAIIYLDEIAEARPDVLVAIHSLTDHRRKLFLDRHDEVLDAPNEFMLVASFNPGYQRGYKELKASTRQRFIMMTFHYPEKNVEMEIIEKETGITKVTSAKLVAIASKIRNLVELGLSETISTRLLVDAGKLIQSGLPPRLACRVAISETLTDDPDIQIALDDIINMNF
jgi:nitric oxide reductase NorQ protein